MIRSPKSRRTSGRLRAALSAASVTLLFASPLVGLQDAGAALEKRQVEVAQAFFRSHCSAVDPFGLGAHWKSCAASGFQMTSDAFNFQNYPNAGSDPALGVHDIVTTATMERWFGRSAVCEHATGTCTPIPAAAEWAKQQATQMTGGHCLGMAGLSEAIFTRRAATEELQPGATTTRELSLATPAVAAGIASWMATQFKPTVQNSLVALQKHSLQQTVEQLVRGINAKVPESMFVFWSHEGSAFGHAVTPVGVDYNGRGRVFIVVYDNNDPSSFSTIGYDISSGSWVGGEIKTSPDAPEYSPTGEAGSLLVVPLSVLQQHSHAPWGGADLPETAEVATTGGTSHIKVLANHHWRAISSTSVLGAVKGEHFLPFVDGAGSGGTLVLPPHRTMAIETDGTPTSGRSPFAVHLSVMLHDERSVTIDETTSCTTAGCTAPTPGGLSVVQSANGAIAIIAPKGATITTATPRGVRTFHVTGMATLDAASTALSGR